MGRKEKQSKKKRKTREERFAKRMAQVFRISQAEAIQRVQSAIERVKTSLVP